MQERIPFLDYLRVIACLMVMLVHSCEPFYLGGEGTQILSYENGFLACFIDGGIRASVPLFVMASSYLLFPVQGSVSRFYLRRMQRVFLPFVIWSVMYAVVPMYGNLYDFYKADGVWINLQQLAYNFVGAAGHLWFVYMIFGIYIVMPILSPWIERAGQKEERYFLMAWGFTTMIPFLRHGAMLHSGLAEFWGEANWNEFGTFYGISGFIGYVVLGHYMRTYVKELSWSKTLLYAIPLLAFGYAICTGGFWAQMPKDLPYEGPIGTAVSMELTWGFCTTGVALMTIGYFLIIRKFNVTGWLYQHIILPVSKSSYGMYLMHIFFLSFYSAVLRDSLNCTLAIILLTCICTYISSFVTSWLIGKIPVIGKYIVG